MSGLFACRQHYAIVTVLPDVLRLILPSFADLYISEGTSPVPQPVQYIFQGNSAPLLWSYFVTLYFKIGTVITVLLPLHLK